MMFAANVKAAVVLGLASFATNFNVAAARDDGALRAIPQTIVDAWNSGNAERLASVYAEDGTLVAGHGLVTRGRADIARYHETLFTGPLKGTKLLVTVTNIRMLEDDVALLQTEGGILSPGERELAPRNRGIQSFVIVKDRDDWRVVLFQNTRILQSP